MCITLSVVPDGTYHWMDSTYYEIFVAPNQEVNTPIRRISFISSHHFRTSNITYFDLVEDITFTLNASYPYFYFTNMMKEEVSFENYYDFYVQDVIEHVSLSLAESVPLGDYKMNVRVTDRGNVLERRNISVHVVTPLSPFPPPSK